MCSRKFFPIFSILCHCGPSAITTEFGTDVEHKRALSGRNDFVGCCDWISARRAAQRGGPGGTGAAKRRSREGEKAPAAVRRTAALAATAGRRIIASARAA